MVEDDERREVDEQMQGLFPHKARIRTSPRPQFVFICHPSSLEKDGDKGQKDTRDVCLHK